MTRTGVDDVETAEWDDDDVDRESDAGYISGLCGGNCTLGGSGDVCGVHGLEPRFIAERSDICWKRSVSNSDAGHLATRLAFDRRAHHLAALFEVPVIIT